MWHLYIQRRILLVARLCKAVSVTIFEIRVCDWMDLRMKIAQYPYVTKELFLEYPRNVVIPSIENN
jgi:hypothetical protein